MLERHELIHRSANERLLWYNSSTKIKFQLEKADSSNWIAIFGVSMNIIHLQ